MKPIDKAELKKLRRETSESLQRRFGRAEAALRLSAWNSICKTMFYNNPKLSLRDAAIQAFQTVKGMKIGRRTIIKLKVGALEALRRRQGEISKPLGKSMSKMQLKLMKHRHAR